MGRIFRAFFWMRWRVLVNSLERTGSRDTIERFSVAAGKLGPIMTMILLVPSAIAMFVLGIVAGFGIATDGMSLPMEVLRYLTLLGIALTVLGPIVLPTRDGGSVARLLLLPIPRTALYMAQVAGALADPWTALMTANLLGVVIGMAVGLSAIGTLVALAAGAAFLLFLLGLASLASSVIHLLLRDRRRGDLVMLVLVLIIPIVAIAPQFFFQEQRLATRKMTRAERQARPPTRTEQVALRLLPYVPSEMYYRAAKHATAPADAALPLAGLAVVALGVQLAGYAAYRRVLDMPQNQAIRRAGSFGGLWNRVIPGLSPAASAIAFTQLRLALRSPRGRATIGSPLLMPLVLAGLGYNRGGLPIPGLQGHYGLALAAMGCFAALLGLIPLSMNQFAIDKAGFTRYMLSPFGVDDLVLGKAVGNALIAAGPIVFCFLLPPMILPGGRLALWVALALALVATFVLMAPAAAALSAVFPKAVDLGSIGNASNAHQGATLLGMLVFVLSAAPSGLLAFLAIGWLRRPELAPLFMLAWCALAFAVSYLLFIPVRRLVASRFETLAGYGRA
ncbi:MAG TPA: hypothetical protein VKH34_03260 [Vicinamibacterales bacterium]|nr:hypothetical protein [Vicinamibacterales bacterium]